MKDLSVADLKNEAKKKEVVKLLTEGESCKLICYLVELQTILGRSTVIDLSAKTDSKFRQIDHRTIESIILRNVKYTLKKASAKSGEAKAEEKKKDEPKWDFSKLAVGNWFSGTSYYRANKIDGDTVQARCESKDITVSKDIMEYEMSCADVFATEEKLALTKVAEALSSANSKCFTVCFNTKIDEKIASEKLSKATAADLNNVKSFAKDLLSGKETTIVGRLSNSDNKLGRSLVVDIASKGYRQVDHRTINWLIINNVKYTVKK